MGMKPTKLPTNTSHWGGGPQHKTQPAAELVSSELYHAPIHPTSDPVINSPESMALSVGLRQTHHCHYPSQITSSPSPAHAELGPAQTPCSAYLLQTDKLTHQGRIKSLLPELKILEIFKQIGTVCQCYFNNLEV